MTRASLPPTFQEPAWPPGHGVFAGSTCQIVRAAATGSDIATAVIDLHVAD